MARKLTSEEAKHLASLANQRMGARTRAKKTIRGKDFRALYAHAQSDHNLKLNPIEVLGIIMNGKAPFPLEHPFLKRVRYRDETGFPGHNRPRWWCFFVRQAEKDLAAQVVTMEHIISAAKELLSYMYPKLKAVDLKSTDGSMTPVLNMLMGDELKDKMEALEMQTVESIEEAEDAEIVLNPPDSIN